MSYWIDYGNDTRGHNIICANCGEDFGNNVWLTKFWYCPNCGEKMEQEDGEDRDYKTEIRY